MAKKGNNMMEEEDLELDDRVMQELLHDDDSSLRNEDDDGPSGSSGSDEEESNDGDKPHYIYNYTPSKQQLLQQKSLNVQQIRDVETINEAASQLFHVIKKYGGDTSSSISSGWDEILTAKNSPWKDNVDAALDEIVAARSSMIEAWDNFHSDNIDRDSQQAMNDDDDDDDDGEQPKMEWWEPILRSKQRSSRDDANNNRFNQANDDDNNNVDEQQFHHVYMEYATIAFATELEALRKGKLEQMCTTSKKKKGVNTNSGKETSSQAMELDLDPTHHSFVVASSKRSRNNDDGDDEAKSAAAEIDVQVLSDMLSSGSNSLSILERNMLLKARQRGSSGAVVTSSEGLSLHERRRQELGLISGR